MATAVDESARSTPRPVELLTEGVIEAGWLVALAAIPLFFNPYSRQSFEPDKAALLRVIVLVMTVAWLAKVATGGRWWRRVAGTGDVGPAEGDPGSRRRVPLLVVGPAALILLSALVATVLSVAPKLSWWGSFHRAQGLATELAYLAVFGLVLAHLRDRAQWRRIAFAVIVASVPVAAYALLQAQGADPIPWASTRRRVGSTLGNPIFLGACLVMAVFVTLHALCVRVGSVLAPQRGTSKAEGRALRREMIQAGVLLYVLVLQVAALVLSESRGPMLGMLAGGYAFALIGLLLARRTVAADRRFPPWLRAVVGRGWLAVLASGLAGVLFLVAFNVPGTPLAPLRDLPYLGRLGTVFDLSSRSARVRLLTWRGTLDLLQSGEPLTAPGAEPDGLHRLRPVVGYGPETFALAIARHQPPELARVESRGEVPDRAHNESFQLLVTNGAAGTLAWLALYCGVFFWGLRWLGLIDSRTRATWFWGAVLAGGLAGGVLPVVITGSAVLSGVGMPAGLVAGVLVFVTVASLRGAAGRLRLGFREGVVLAILATVIGHFVEVHFGIAITGTRLYLWVLTASMIAVGSGWVAGGPAEERPAAASGSKRGPRRSDRRSGSSSSLWQAGAAGLVTAAVAIIATYGLLGNWDSSTRAGAIISSALFGSGEASAGSLLWILLFAWLVAAVMAGGLTPTTAPGPYMWSFAAASLGPAALYCGLHASRLAATAGMQLAGVDPMQASQHVSHHVTWFAVTLVLLVVAAGGALAAAAGLQVRPLPFAAVGLTAAIIISAGITVAVAGVRTLRATTFVKHGQAFAESGRVGLGLRLIERGIELDHREPMHLLALGVASTDAARDDRTERERLYATARTSFETARRMAPLDPDHTQNLARMWAQRGFTAANDANRAGHLRHAEREYRAVISMRPYSAQLVMELVGVLEALGETDELRELAERAVELDPSNPSASIKLATLYRREAELARELGDPEDADRIFDLGLAVLGRSRTEHPESTAVARAEAGLLVIAGRADEAIAAYLRYMERFGEDWATHRVLALLYAEAGRRATAVRHAERALALAAPGQKAVAAGTLAHVRNLPEDRDRRQR